LLLIPVFRFFSLKEKAKRVLGQAHFAGIWEARSLFTKKGIVLGKAFGRILRLPGDESVLLTAPTGSGKTAGIAIPNLIEWTDSVVVNDLKGELFSKTADLRRHTHQQPVFRFAPADETQNTHGYNPFFYVRKEPNLIIRDLQLIAEILIPDERLGDGFWHKSSREIFVLLSLYLQETNGVATLGDVYVLGRQAHFLQWLQLAVLEGKVKNPVFYHYATSLLEADERTRHNILKDFHSRISLLADPLIVHATQKNDFDFRELRKKAMSIYIHIPDADVSRLKPLLTLFWAQLIYELSKQEPDLKKEPYRVLALLDEFGHLGKMDVLKSITFLRSYRMRFVLMVQHLGQIVSVYGREEAKNFLNAKVRMAFALNDDDDAKLFASDLGTKTVSVLSNSNHSGRRDGSSSQSRSFRSRELMMKDELKKLHKKQEIILIESMNPIKAKKCLWFKERRYRDFLKQYREGICKSDI
jgi:type IV secretion system protein VirD4